MSETGGTMVIGHVALIQRSKKQDFVLKLISMLIKQGYDAVGFFAGECRDEGYYAELKEQIQKLGLQSSVAFLGRRNDIPDLLQMIDVLIIPSAFEGFPLAGLEAAAAGVPVIACDAAGAEEFIRVSGDGITFKEDDIASGLEAVKCVLKKAEKYRQSGIAFAEEMAFMKYCERIKIAFDCVTNTL